MGELYSRQCYGQQHRAASGVNNFCPFFAMLYENDGRHLPGDEALETDRMLKARKNNFDFFQKKTLVNASGFKFYKILLV